MPQVKKQMRAGVGLLSKAFQILDLFQTETPVWSQAELVRATGFNRSTLNRLVGYLSDCGYLTLMRQSGRYSLGPAAIDLGRRAIASFNLREICQPVLERLAAETEETVILTALDESGRTVVCVDQIESRRGGLRVFQQIGTALPLHAGASPKAVLALLPADERDRYMADTLAAVTPHTIVDAAALRTDIERTIGRGYAVSREETYDGVVGVAAAFAGPNDRPAGSIAIAGPIQRIPQERVDHFGTLLLTAAAEIQDLIGGRAAQEAAGEDAA